MNSPGMKWSYKCNWAVRCTRSITEAYAQAQKGLGVQDSFRGINLKPWDYKDSKFIIGIDAEKVVQAGFTCEKTKAGSLLTIKAKQPSAILQIHQITGMYVTLHSDNILNIRDTGFGAFD